MRTPICIIATITPHAEHFASAREALLRIVPQTLDEPGCQVFRLAEGEDGRLHLYEEWADATALEAHYDMPYTRAVFDAYEEWLAEPVDILKLKRLA